MKAEITFVKPEDIQATISLTFTLAEWARIQKALSDSAWNNTTSEVIRAIRDLTDMACGTIHFTPEKD